MIPVPSGVRVWLATGNTDIRKGFASPLASNSGIFRIAARLATVCSVFSPPKRTKALEIGFFQERGAGDHWTYWVPFLYRDALSMSQGAADEA